MPKEEFMDTVYWNTGGLARMICRIGEYVNEEKKPATEAVDLTTSNFKSISKTVLNNLYSSLKDIDQKKKMVTSALRLRNNFAANISTPGIFHDRGITVFDVERDVSRVINNPAVEVLNDFVSGRMSWKPIDLKVCSQLFLGICGYSLAHCSCFCVWTRCFSFRILKRRTSLKNNALRQSLRRMWPRRCFEMLSWVYELDPSLTV